MRKLLLVVLLLALGLGLLTAAATPVDELSGLAQYYPENTPLWAVLRTDDAFVGILDGVFQKAASGLPVALPPGLSLDMLLEQLAMQATGTDFQTGIRSWLGDSAAVGLLSANLMGSSPPPILFTVEITDGEAALEVITALLTNNGEMNLEDFASVTEAGDWTILSFDYDDLVIALNDEVLFIAMSPDDMPLDGQERSLAGNPSFTDNLASLPGDDYNMLFYVDGGAINQVNMGMMREMGLEISPFLETVYQMDMTAVVGFAIDGDSTLMIDVAGLQDITPMTNELGFTVSVPSAAELSFAEFIPADAPMIIPATDFGPSTLASFENLRALDDYVRENGGWYTLLGIGDNMGISERLILDNFRFSDFIFGANVGFAGLTGMNLERDVLPWMTGDYALFIRATEADLIPYLPDMAVVMEVADGEAATAMINNFAGALEAYGPQFGLETDGDITMVVMPWLRSLLGEGEPLDEPALNIALASDGEILAFGTMNAVTAVFDPDEPKLADTDAFISASEFLLPGSQQVWYIGTLPFVNLIDGLLPLMDRYAARDLLDVRTILALFDSASISMVASENGSSVMRAVLTLADEPVPPPDIDFDATEEPMVPLATATAPLFTSTPAPTQTLAPPTATAEN